MLERFGRQPIHRPRKRSSARASVERKRCSNAFCDHFLISCLLFQILPYDKVSLVVYGIGHMPQTDQAKGIISNIEQARSMRASGLSYRAIRVELGVGASQLRNIRRGLRREKAGYSILKLRAADASNRDLPVKCSVLPAGLRKALLTSKICHTLGDLADRLADPKFPGLETLPGIGPHRSALVKRLLNELCVRPACFDLRDEVELTFPELFCPI